MRRVLASGAVLILALTACSTADESGTAETAPTSEAASPSEPPATSESPSAPAASPTEDADDDREAIEIEIEGDEVEPRGRRVKVTAGEPIPLKIESDRAAELHVHSSPEQVLSVKAGKSAVDLTIKTPGIVDVEEHETGIVVLQLEVR